jgi:hypothetical protein
VAEILNMQEHKSRKADDSLMPATAWRARWLRQRLPEHLTLAESTLLIHMACFMDRNGRGAVISVETLSVETSISLGTVERALTSLRRIGLLVPDGRRAGKVQPRRLVIEKLVPARERTPVTPSTRWGEADLDTPSNHGGEAPRDTPSNHGGEADPVTPSICLGDENRSPSICGGDELLTPSNPPFLTPSICGDNQVSTSKEEVPVHTITSVSPRETPDGGVRVTSGLFDDVLDEHQAEQPPPPPPAVEMVLRRAPLELSADDLDTQCWQFLAVWEHETGKAKPARLHNEIRAAVAATLGAGATMDQLIEAVLVQASECRRASPSKWLLDGRWRTGVRDMIPMPTLPEVDNGFEAFWSAYPRKDAKGRARKAWNTATRTVPTEVIMAGLARYQFADDPRYQPMPATWLNDERWSSVQRRGVAHRRNEPATAADIDRIFFGSPAPAEDATTIDLSHDEWRDA